jgi:integrase
MAKYRFNLRHPESDIATPIHLIVRWEGNKLVYPTGLEILPKFWQADKKKQGFQRAIAKGFKQHPEFNTRLDYIDVTAKNTFRKFVNDHNQQPTMKVYRELLHMAFNKKAPLKHDLISFAESFAESAKIRTSNKVSTSTIQAYGQTILHLKSFKEATRTRSEFDNIDEDFYNAFVAYLTDTKKFSPNTIGKHIKHLKVFIREAKSVNPELKVNVDKFKGIKEDTDSIYLSHKELTDLYDLDLSDNNRLERVRDLFILGAYTGLRFSDFSRLAPENITGDRIKITSQKTKKPVSIPFHHTVKSIVSKYESVFPVISNVKMNEYLKDLGKLCESLKVDVKTTKTKGATTVNKKVKKHDLLTTHTARRSFATNAYLDGIPTLTIMAITGHSTEKSFLRYIKVTPDEHATILESLWNKSANKSKLKIA